MDSHMNGRITQARHFIARTELADSSLSLKENLAGQDMPDGFALPEPAGAAVAGSNLLVFTEGVSRQNREDVMDSFLFATLVANKAFNPETQSQEWYARFNKVLATVGWLSTNWSYARYQSIHQRFSMDQAGLKILSSAIAAAALPGPASIAMLKVASEALASLAQNPEPLRLFERQTKSHSGASFRIGACAEAADGTLTLAMGAVNMRTNAEVTNVLFWEWNSAQIEADRGEDALVLNSGLYAGIRDQIRQRLGSNAKLAIAEFEI